MSSFCITTFSEIKKNQLVKLQISVSTVEEIPNEFLIK